MYTHVISLYALPLKPLLLYYANSFSRLFHDNGFTHAFHQISLRRFLDLCSSLPPFFVEPVLYRTFSLSRGLLGAAEAHCREKPLRTPSLCLQQWPVLRLNVDCTSAHYQTINFCELHHRSASIIQPDGSYDAHGFCLSTSKIGCILHATHRFQHKLVKRIRSEKFHSHFCGVGFTAEAAHTWADIPHPHGVHISSLLSSSYQSSKKMSAIFPLTHIGHISSGSSCVKEAGSPFNKYNLIQIQRGIDTPHLSIWTGYMGFL